MPPITQPSSTTGQAAATRATRPARTTPETRLPLRCRAFNRPASISHGPATSSTSELVHQAVTATVSTPVTCAAGRTAHIPGMTETMIDDRWARFGNDAEDTLQWQAHGFDATEAAVWCHYRIAPADARAWERAGFHGGDLPSRACCGTTTVSPRGTHWPGADCRGGPPAQWCSRRPSRCCSGSTVSPRRRRGRGGGGFTAVLAVRWREAGVSVTVAARWINGGFDDPDVGAPWIEVSATPAEASLFLRACRDTDEALEWRERGFDAGSVPGWVDAGFTPPTKRRSGRPGGSSPPTQRRGGPSGSAPSKRSCGGRSGSNRPRPGRSPRAECGIR
jgi:hypothetical protein